MSSASQHASPQELETTLREKVAQAENAYRHASDSDKTPMLERYLAALAELMDFKVYGETHGTASPKPATAAAGELAPYYLRQYLRRSA